MEAMRETISACVDTVTEIETNADTFYTTVRKPQGKHKHLANFRHEF